MSDQAPFLRRSVKAVEAIVAAIDEHQGHLIRCRAALSGAAAKASDELLQKTLKDTRGELMRARRIFHEDLDALTPVRSPSSTNLSAVRGIATRVGSILEGDKK